MSPLSDEAEDCKVTESGAGGGHSWKMTAGLDTIAEAVALHEEWKKSGVCACGEKTRGRQLKNGCLEKKREGAFRGKGEKLYLCICCGITFCVNNCYSKCVFELCVCEMRDVTMLSVGFCIGMCVCASGSASPYVLDDAPLPHPSLVTLDLSSAAV